MTNNASKPYIVGALCSDRLIKWQNFEKKFEMIDTKNSSSVYVHVVIYK